MRLGAETSRVLAQQTKLLDRFQLKSKDEQARLWKEYKELDAIYKALSGQADLVQREFKAQLDEELEQLERVLRDRAVEYLKRNYDQQTLEFVILNEPTIRKAYGSVFFCEIKRWTESSEVVVEILPIVVLERDESVHALSSARPIEEELSAFEKSLDLKLSRGRSRDS
jgi:hypothetical protein